VWAPDDTRRCVGRTKSACADVGDQLAVVCEVRRCLVKKTLVDQNGDLVMNYYYYNYDYDYYYTVGLVIWPVEIVPEMTYNVLSGTLSLYTTTAHHQGNKLLWIISIGS